MTDVRTVPEDKNSLRQLLSNITFVHFAHIFSGLVFILSIAVVIYIKLKADEGYYAVFLIVSTTLLLLSFLQGRVLFKNISAARNEINASLDNSHKDMTTTIKRYLEPSIWILSSQDSVIDHAADALKKASQEESQTDRFVYIFGAAALSNSKTASSDSDVNDPATAYRNALAELARTHTPVDRYINLFDDNAFRLRSERVQIAYMDWLNRQLNLMKENPAYHLWQTIRAGEWGSARSTIVTRRHVLDIVGDGISGVHITGRDVSTLVFTQTIKHIYASAKANEPTAYDHRKLSKYLDRISNLKPGALNEAKKQSRRSKLPDRSENHPDKPS